MRVCGSPHANAVVLLSVVLLQLDLLAVQISQHVAFLRIVSWYAVVLHATTNAYRAARWT